MLNSHYESNVVHPNCFHANFPPTLIGLFSVALKSTLQPIEPLMISRDERWLNLVLIKIAWMCRQLNGNPGLTGPLPTEIQMCWLNYL